MSAFKSMLQRFREAAASKRELGTYFEEATVSYFRNEPAYKDLYREVVPYSVWAERRGIDSFAVCSDSDVGKKRKNDDDTVQTFVHELQYPATTDPASLAKEMKRRHGDGHMSVVYATYHSIEVVHRAQKEHKLPAFDLIAPS
jgi:predicted helicase